MIRALIFDFDGLILDTETTQFETWQWVFDQHGCSYSPNGILAASRAGILCVAVPNSVTRHLDLDLADVRINSFEDVPLKELLGKARRRCP